MDRRAWVLGCTALLGTPGVAWAQAAARRRIAVLNSASAAGMRRDLVDQLREGLAELGWVDGRDIELHVRFAEGQHAMRLAETAARPGGHFTGISAAFDGVLQRRIQLLADLLPGRRRFGVLLNPMTVRPAGVQAALRHVEAAFSLLLVQANDPAEFDAAFQTLARERVDGLVVLADASFFVNRHDLGARCGALKLPSVWGHRDYLDAGGVASYQGDFRALFRRSTVMIDKILRGTPPGEIPFEQGTKFELVLHLGNAKALGLTVPARVRVAADEVIE